MSHRQFSEGARAEGRAVRAFFHSPVARGALWSGLVLLLAILPARAQTPEPPNAPQSSAQSSDQKLDQLQQKVDELDQAIKVAQRKQELAEEAAAGKEKAAASVTADTGSSCFRWAT